INEEFEKVTDSDINTPYLKTLKNSRSLPDFEEYVVSTSADMPYHSNIASEEVSPVVKGPLDASEDTLISLRRPVDEVRRKFSEFFEDKGCVKKGVRNVTPSTADGERRKRVKCYVQGSERRKRMKVIGRGSERRFVMGWDNHHTYLLSRICV
ncbi:hypothetical protein Tco_0999781, partial [Tanacetum coccineum]